MPREKSEEGPIARVRELDCINEFSTGMCREPTSTKKYSVERKGTARSLTSAIFLDDVEPAIHGERN